MGKNISFNDFKRFGEFLILVGELSEFQDKESLSEEEQEKVMNIAHKCENLLEEFIREGYPDLIGNEKAYVTFFEGLTKVFEMCQRKTVE